MTLSLMRDFHSKLDKNKSHDVEIVVDRLAVKNFQPLYKELASGEKLEIPNPDRTRLADSRSCTRWR